MTDIELVACVKAVNDAKFETADTIKQLIYKYGIEDTLPYIGDCIVIRRETLAVIFDILAPEMETDEEYERRCEPEEDETENEQNDT